MNTLCVTQRFIGLVFGVALVACESGGSAPPIGPSTGPPLNLDVGIALTVSNAVVTTPRTGNAFVDIGVTRIGNFGGIVDLSIQELPPGVSGSFTTTTLSSTDVGSRLNIEVESTAEYGTYQLTVRANGAGVSPSTVTISLVVPQPSFSISVDPRISYFTSKDFFIADDGGRRRNAHSYLHHSRSGFA